MRCGYGRSHGAAYKIGAAKMKPVTMTIKGACSYSGLSKSTLYNLVNAKKLEIRKVGKRTLITTASIENVLGLSELEAV